MNQSAFQRFIGLLVIGSSLTACGTKESPSVRRGITESSAGSVAEEACTGFTSYLHQDGHVTDPTRLQEVQTVCEEGVGSFASGSAGIKRLTTPSLVYPIVFSIMNELHSPSGTGAPWEAEGAGATRELVRQILHFSPGLEECTIGSTPECR